MIVEGVSKPQGTDTLPLATPSMLPSSTPTTTPTATPTMAPAAIFVSNQLDGNIAAPYSNARGTFETGDLERAIFMPELHAGSVIVLASNCD